MKKVFLLLLVCVIVLGMVGCQTAEEKINIPNSAAFGATQSGETQSGETGAERQTPAPYGVQYIRTDGGTDTVLFPCIRIISSVQDLKDYCTVYRELFDLERKETVYSDTTIGFLDACDKYDAAFFETNFLIFVLLEEGSGSIRHEVRSVVQTEEQKLQISVDRIVPECGTDDMAQWHIMLELSRDVIVESSADIMLYVDGEVSYMDDKIVYPQQQAAYKEPPKGVLITPEEAVNLTSGGYHWTYQNADGTAVSTIADQVSRPLPEESLMPVVISSQYAETVYAPVPGSTAYEPTNSLGYLVKLDWETMPTSVTYACWPDTVWENSHTPEESVSTYGDGAFYAKPGGYVYEIVATWDNTGAGYHASANYYVFITDKVETHTHMTALRPQTVEDPFIGYCGNTQTTLYIGNKEYSFMYGYSVALTDILVNLDYNPNKVCRCMPQYRADTEFGLNYHINLEYGFARCEKGQADLTQEQIDVIAEIVEWAETTNCQYPVDE